MGRVPRGDRGSRVGFSWWVLFPCQTLRQQRVRAGPSSEISREWGICQLGVLLTLSRPSQWEIPHSTTSLGVENLHPHRPPERQRHQFLSRGAPNTKPKKGILVPHSHLEALEWHNPIPLGCECPRDRGKALPWAARAWAGARIHSRLWETISAHLPWDFPSFPPGFLQCRAQT